jgi:hypothetical protein
MKAGKMKPGKSEIEFPRSSLFPAALVAIINPRHPLPAWPSAETVLPLEVDIRQVPRYFLLFKRFP